MTKKKNLPARRRPSTKSAAPRKPRKANFDDESQVLREIARELDIDRGELEIKTGSSPNGHN